MDSRQPDYTARGPYPVGVLHTTVYASNDPDDSDRNRDRPLPTEVWFPALAPRQPTEPAPHPFGAPHDASPGLAPIDAPCGLVAFSHGNSGLRQQSTFLTTHLASWGIVVAAPDHLGNTFSEMIALADDEARRTTHRRIRRQRPHDLLAVIRSIGDEAQLADDLPPLDLERLGVLGHSFGGWTSLKMPALDPRIRNLCCLAPASEPFVGRRAFDAGELPLRDEIETLVLAGENDVLVDLDTSIRPLVERLGSRSRLEVIERADHFHFCDGLEMLHKMHANNPREGQSQPTRPLSQLRSESEMHSIVNERVARFFVEGFAKADQGRFARAAGSK